jgi:hypothetical protein
MRTIGTLAGAARAAFGIDVDAGVERTPVRITWWVGADDGWHDPARETTTRYRRPGVAPSYETAVRVPTGDLVQRVYALATPGGDGAIAIDFENTSRAPCSLVVFVAIDAPGRLRLERDVLWLDEERVLTFAQTPRLWASGSDVRAVVASGGASATDAPAWDAPGEIALLAPLAHGTVLRTALTRDDVDARTLADPFEVERGWQRQLERGMRTELPARLQHEVDGCRADLLLVAPSSTAFAALEDWGFDAEAEAMWSHLGFRARRAARQRGEMEDLGAAQPVSAGRDDPAAYLLTVRQSLVYEHRGHVDLLPGFRSEWLGQNVAVHDAPLRAGRLSFALRWHGARPALLWDAPPDVALRIPALDPSWSTAGGAGETLLVAPPAPLLAMGSPQREGDRIDDPDSFG